MFFGINLLLQLMNENTRKGTNLNQLIRGILSFCVIQCIQNESVNIALKY